MLDPIKTTEAIKDRYLSYLSTTFRPKDADLQKQFRERLQAEEFIKGPILEATPPFEVGKSLNELIEEDILSDQFRRLKSKELPLDRPLYRHQEEAICKTARENRNIVVATGTGSGKTEAFLVPILNHLFQQMENGRLDPGVRALLLYPMNALANDQLKRMQSLLKNYPDITFGRYTGETRKKEKWAKEKYQNMHKKDPSPNELISREKMIESPPHILLTNYAMLEYLMLRPEDHIFFDGEYADEWRFIVIDEAHTYTGAKGIEMTMLLRRLKDRVVQSEPNRLQCIATSATLGKGEEDFPDVAGFAEKLFGEKFEPQNVIGAVRKPMEVSDSWGKPNPSLYEEWQGVVRTHSISDLIETGKKYGVPDNILETSKNKAENGYKRFLYYVLKGDERLILLKKLLEESPQSIAKVAEEIFPNISNPKDALVALVALAVQTEPPEDDQSLLPARYHLFVRAVEGAYLNLCPKKEVYLRQREEINHNGRGYPVFEMAVCRQCGATYLVGETTESPFEKEVLDALREEGFDVHKQVKCGKYRIDLAIADPKQPDRYLLGIECQGVTYHSSDAARKKDADRKKELEDVGWKIHEVWSTDWEKDPNGEIARIKEKLADSCSSTDRPRSSSFRRKNILKQIGKNYFEDPKSLEYYLLLDKEPLPVDNEDEDEVKEPKEERYKLCGDCGAIDKANLVFPLCSCGQENHFDLLKVSSKDGKIHKCPACARTNPKGFIVWRFIFGKDAIATVLATSLYQQIPPRDGDLRQLLIFSDNRQDAAFFAPYLDRTYSQILRRSLILEVVKENRERVIENRWRVQDLIPPLKQKVKQLNLLPRESLQGIEDEVWKWVLHEFLCIDSRINLEGLGCLGFSIVKPDGWRPPKSLVEDWQLSEDEAWILFKILLDSFRKTGAILFPDNIPPEDEFFQPRNRECYFREHGSFPKKQIKSWRPSSKNVSNSRLNFIERLAERIGADTSGCREILKKIWQEEFGNPSSCWKKYFSTEGPQGEGTAYRMRHDLWELRLSKESKWYYCDKCNNITLLNLRGICPTYRCEGRLKECNPQEIFAENHYRRLYLETLPLRMEAKEHTAQLTSEAAAELQDQFRRGEVNILSCSTTFELGVDIGDLESIFMRNVPPSPANYLQRAGRAGRRTDSAAFALTFCQRRSHDLAHFDDPLQMVSGKIRPPYFEVRNEKIVKRHIYATAMAKFWREYRDEFWPDDKRMDVNSFFFNKKGTDLFKEYLDSKPDGLYGNLKRIVPVDLHQHKDLNLETWEWTLGLFDKEEGVLLKATEEVQNDVEELEKKERQLADEKKYKSANYISNTINTIKDRYLLHFLSSRNVIPKYGFPVDVVELQILHHSDEAKRLELNRDLRIALSEYAPSSQIVAGGGLWTSRYLKKLPQREWLKYRYAVCDHCQCYQSVFVEGLKKDLDNCNACGRLLEGKNQGTFIFPEFGFIADTKLQRPGEEQPKKTYTTRTHYSGESKEGDRLAVELRNGVGLIATPASDGRMAVLNQGGGQRFKVCYSCGYTILGNEKKGNSHKSSWGTDCSGKLYGGLAIGHEYLTDILQLHFEGYVNHEKAFWLSLLYAILEGASKELDIERQDLDGCLHSYTGDPVLVFFDNVPGGAGHVQRIAKDEATLISVLKSTLQRLEKCKCDTSCYGCLRNYRNQFCHDELNREKVISFLKEEISI